MLTVDEELNDQVLRNMREGGDDLSIARPVYFQVVFHSLDQAVKFAEVVGRRGLRAEVSEHEDGPVAELPWDVTVTVKMQPELAAISRYECDLSEIASSHQGRGDGWFCERIVPDKA